MRRSTRRPWGTDRAARSLRLTAVLGALSLVIAVAVPMLAGCEPAKDYEMGPLDISAVVDEDGSVVVTESRTFDFTGDFTFVAWKLNTTGADRIEVIGLDGPEGPYERTDSPTAAEDRPPGTYLVTDQGDAVEVRAFFRRGDESVPFVLQYRAVSAATRWTDTGELYWQFIGDESEKGASDIRVRVQLPAPPGEQVVPGETVRAWVHGPLTGSFDVNEDGSVGAELDYLPSHTFVEFRAAFPREWVPGAPEVDSARLETILAEEGRWAEEANRIRDEAQRDEDERRFRERYVNPVVAYGSALFALTALGLAGWLFARFGKEHRLEFTGEYFRELPSDLPPALVGALWRMGGVDDADIAATLMNLANAGIVTMRPLTVAESGGFLGLGPKETQTYELTLDRARLAGAHPLERELAEVLFDSVGGGGDTFTIEDLKAYAKANARTFAARMSAWKAGVKEAAEKEGFFEKSGRSVQVGLVVLAVVVTGVAIAGAAISGRALPAVTGIPAAIAVGVIAVVSGRRSRAANELYARYKGLRNYLRDFSRLDEAPPTHVKLWEHFLVLAVVFGIADQVIAQLRVRVPEVVSDPAFQTAYWWTYSAGAYSDSPVGALQGGFASAASIASSEMSSSSGGGGGFSGGGGGGGGGGGVSAG